MSRRIAFLLLAILLVPGAVAAGTHAASGRLLAEGVDLRGRVVLEGEGLLEVEPGDAGEALDVSFGRLAEGWLVHRTRENVHLGLPGADGPSVLEPSATNVSIRAEGEGRVENLRCGPRCLVALYAVPGEGLVGASGVADATFVPAQKARNVSTSTPGNSPWSQFLYALPPGTLEATSAGLDGARASVSGRIGLVVSDATFDLVDADGRRTVDARSGPETTREAAGRTVTFRNHTRHAVLLLDGPRITLAPDASFRLGFPAGAQAQLDGALDSHDATGALLVDAQRHPLDHEHLFMEGTLTLRLQPTQGDSPHAHAWRTQVEGRVTTILLSGVDVTPAIPLRAKGVGTSVALGLGIALLARLLLVPLFHRLGPMDVLGNANRRRVYEEVRARPGVSVAELVASVGLARVLVRHHLRMLETHRLVRATAWRRRRTYAVVGEEAGRAACELKDPTRRRVAAAIARSGRATQKDLVGALGLSQRLVSYHLARLEDSGLVRTEGKNPRSYVATDALARAVEREESTASAHPAATLA